MSEKSSASLKNYSRAVLLAVVVFAAGLLIIRNIDVTKNILLVMLGFGAVVLVHEFGHFVVAKACGIKVEAFSIFMPPILLGIKKADRGWRIRILPELFRNARLGARLGEGAAQTTERIDSPSHSQDGQDSDDGLLSFSVGRKILPGETEYRIGLIPFGGFVKMLGQDDVGPVKASNDPRSFANKPALVRAAVFAAGVTFNVISAVIVFMTVFLVGINLMSPVVGGVIPGSPAQRAGIRPGDEILEVAGSKDGRLDFSDVVMAGALSGKGKEVAMKIRHEGGTIEDISLVAEQLPGGQFRGFGIEKPMSLTVAILSAEDANRLFDATGLLPGDRIKAVDGVDVNSYWQLEQIVRETFAPDITVLAERPQTSGEMQLVEGRLSLGFVPMACTGAESEANPANICGLAPRLRITAVSDEPRSIREWLSRVRQAHRGRLPNKGEDVPRLKPGDIIVAVAGAEDPIYPELRQLTTASEGKALPVTVLRSDANGSQQRVTVPVVPRKERDTERVIIGIAVELDVERAVVAKTIATEQHPEPIAVPRGAAIIAIDGVEVKSFYDIAKQLEQNSGQRVTIDWRLDEEVAGNIAVDVGKQEGLVVYPYFKEPVPFENLERLYRADGPVDAIAMGYKRTKTFIVQAYVTLQRILSGLVSPKQLMGPVGILTFSYRIVAAQPIIYYIYFLGLISAVIAVFNFLPLPPLDGGLTLLLLVEKIKGTALSVRTQEVIAYLGWGLVGTFFLYVTFNDIVRSFFS